ncbi:Tc toxin subunit A [Pseudomonas sp. GNP012]
MAAEHPQLINALVNTDLAPNKGKLTFKAAMLEMGFTSVFDIVRLNKSDFARQLAVLCDVDAGLAYDNAMGYASLLARLYREYKTSSGKFQVLAERSGVRSLTQLGPTFPNLFKENWDEFCKVGALAAVDSPVAYLSALMAFVRELETLQPADPKRILLDKRRPDLKDLLISQESTFKPRPMLKIVNDTLDRNLKTYLQGIAADRNKPIHQVLTERHYPFQLPYNFYHHQCQLGLSGKSPELGELNYRASVWLPIDQDAMNRYGAVQHPTLQAQRLLTGLSPEQQCLLIEPSPYSDFYLSRGDLNNLPNGWQSDGSAQLSPHAAMTTCYLLPTGQADIDTANPPASNPITTAGGTTSVPMTFRIKVQVGPPPLPPPLTMTLRLSNGSAINTNTYRPNSMQAASSATICARIVAAALIPVPTIAGYTVSFDLNIATGSTSAWTKLLRRRFTLTLDEQYQLTAAEQAYFKKAYGTEISTPDTGFLDDLNTFMQHTGLHAEQVEMLLSRRTYAVRLSPNCPSKNLQANNSVIKFPYPSHYGACYVNGTGAGRYDSEIPPTAASIRRDKFDNAMDLEYVKTGDRKTWRLSKTSLNRYDRLQRMIRLQRWTGIPFAKLDTLIICAIRAEGENNLGMELNENTLRALGVYRYLNRRHGIDPQEFAALMHDLTPYTTSKDELPLFDQVFNRMQLFDTPLVLDQASFTLTGPTPANQKTLLQLCAGLGLQPTEDSLLLIARQTMQLQNNTLKRDLPTVSSLFRQARIAQLFGLSVADLLTLATLLGGQRYKTALASGRLSPRTSPQTPDILDVLMQLAWAIDWLKDSQQTIAQLQQRLGPDIPLLKTEDLQDDPSTKAFVHEPLSDDLRARLIRLNQDIGRNVVDRQQVEALELPLYEDTGNGKPVKIEWFERLISQKLLDEQGLLPGLDNDLTLVDEPLTWLGTDLDQMLAGIRLDPTVKQRCKEQLITLLLDAHDRQTQLLEALFQETAQLPSDRTVAVMYWAFHSVYAFLQTALDAGQEPSAQLITDFQRICRHAEIAVHLRLSNDVLRVFLLNPQWLGDYPLSNSKSTLPDLYLLERFSHWLNDQQRPQDSLLSYFRLANPGSAQLKTKALRQAANETANAALARLLGWSEKEVQQLTSTLPNARACSMAQVDWVRRCQATCIASGLSARSLLLATALNHQSTLNDWKTVGDAVMAAHTPADSAPASV